MAENARASLPRGSRTKLRLRRWVLGAAGTRHIHIVGCARSGTTMLHYAMIAFADTMLIDKEISVLWAPTLRQSSELLAERLRGGPAKHVVTKREYGWYLPTHVDDLVDCTLRERIGIINIVRDPRDVFSSHHALDTPDQLYVEPERWLASVRAGDQVFERLDAHPHKLTVRYEDLVTDPRSAQARIASQFALALRPGIESIGHLKDNLERLRASTGMAAYLQQIRNFDPKSIGAWRRDPRKTQHVEQIVHGSSISRELADFMDRYGYQR
jgi:hypothetical protein